MKLEFGEITACILYVLTDTTIYIARLIIERPREWLASLAEYTKKMVPIPRRARSFLVVVFIHVNRKEAEEGETEKQQQFT